MALKRLFVLFFALCAMPILFAGGDYLVRNPRLNRGTGIFKCGVQKMRIERPGWLD